MWRTAGAIVACGTSSVLAQAPASPAAPAMAAAKQASAAPLEVVDVAPPLPREAMKTFLEVEGWVRGLEVPREPVVIDGTRGACVVLRLDHKVIGRGVSMREDGTGVWEAARLAIGEAIGRIPTANDATAREFRNAAAARITISLELGGRMVPLAANTWNEIDAQVNVAMDAVAARVNVGEEERGAATFPSVMRAGADRPSAGVARAVAEASGNPLLALPSDAKSTPRALREQHGVRLYSFGVTHLAQSDASAAPTFLYRGSRLVQGADITRDSIERWSAQMLSHLARRYDVARLEPGVEAGATPPRAPMAPELAITIRALDQRLSLGGLSKQAKEDAANAIAAMRGRLRDQFPKDKAISAMSAASMVLAGVCGDDAPQIRDRVDEALNAAATSDGEWSPTVSAASRGFIVWAMVERARSMSGAARDSAMERAERAARAIYRDTRESDLVAQMPWLFFAERVLAKDRDTIAAAATLRSVRELVVKHQLTPSDAGDEGMDLVGGVVYTRQGAALPNAQSGRAIAYLCAIVGDSRVTNAEESLGELTHALAGVRFLRQLTMDDASAYFAIEPDVAIGGVQSAAWDPSQPIEATALSLMAACEMLNGLDTMAKLPASDPGRERATGGSKEPETTVR